MFWFVVHKEYYNRQQKLATIEIRLRQNGLSLDERAELYQEQLNQRTAVRRFKLSNTALLDASMPEIGKIKL